MALQLEQMIAGYIVAAPLCAYQGWKLTAKSEPKRRVRLRTLLTAGLFTPGVIGIGHGIGIAPAWIGVAQGLMASGHPDGPVLFFVNAIAQACGLGIARKIARSFEERHDGKRRDKYKFSA